MSNKTASVIARVEPEVKVEAEEILSQLGLSASCAINMLYKQIVMTRRIPFDIALPNSTLPEHESEVGQHEN